MTKEGGKRRNKTWGYIIPMLPKTKSYKSPSSACQKQQYGQIRNSPTFQIHFLCLILMYRAKRVMNPNEVRNEDTIFVMNANEWQ